MSVQWAGMETCGEALAPEHNLTMRDGETIVRTAADGHAESARPQLKQCGICDERVRGLGDLQAIGSSNIRSHEPGHLVAATFRGKLYLMCSEHGTFWSHPIVEPAAEVVL